MELRSVIYEMRTKKSSNISNLSSNFEVAPQVGLEPTTLRLTAGCSAN